MTVLGLKGSHRTTAVSNLHGFISRRMWSDLWPGRNVDSMPIGHITNGVHVGQLARLADAAAVRPAFSLTYWADQHGGPECGRASTRSTRASYGRPTTPLKGLLIGFARSASRANAERRGEPAAMSRWPNTCWIPRCSTIGLARRFATYKRAALILTTLTAWRR